MTLDLTYFGLDGEGKGRDPHRYVFLACGSEDGSVRRSVEDDRGLHTEECLEMILVSGQERGNRLFSFSFNYDLTKMLADVDNKRLYYLFRPELRKRTGNFAKLGPWPVHWRGFTLNLQGTKFTVQDGEHKVNVWDLFKFYQTSFVKALELWKVGSKEEVDRMKRMKDLRSEFDKLDSQQVRDYCFDECSKMATLAHRLCDAHKAAGLKLTSFHGAGSSGKAMLTKMGVRKYMTKVPDEMAHAVSSSFFGGRFENSRIGRVPQRVYGFDISSAYPYQAWQLPCLVHTRWERATSEVMAHANYIARNPVLVEYEYDTSHGDPTDGKRWAPMPFRDRDGSICYPRASGGGWVWMGEYLQAKRMARLRFKSAWVGRRECDHRPFRQVPEYYVLRCKLGKEGPGIVIKLGLNSCYGKLAQSIGVAVFNNWIWASLITSGCRAQLLELMNAHRDLDNVLMVATDGVYTLEDVPLPAPLNTGTGDTGKPLGGWERKVVDTGIFLARPGIYFPLDGREAFPDSIRARGLGRSVVQNYAERIMTAWDQHGMTQIVRLPDISRFSGAKSSISRSGPPLTYAEGKLRDPGTYKRSINYGEWHNRPVEMSFDPQPKRDRLVGGNRLTLRTMPTNQVSMPYTKAILSTEAAELIQLREEALEQPEGEFDVMEHDNGD